MPRPPRCRRVCALPDQTEFGPSRTACPGGPIVMTVDEYETIRLVDLGGLTQEQCAAQMDVARTTVTGIYDSARKKLAEAIVNGRRLRIEGGSYRLCDASGACPRHAHHACPRCGQSAAPCGTSARKDMKRPEGAPYDKGGTNHG